LSELEDAAFVPSADYEVSDQIWLGSETVFLPPLELTTSQSETSASRIEKFEFATRSQYFRADKLLDTISKCSIQISEHFEG